MINNKKLVIAGVGETAEIAYEYFTNDSDFDVVGFVVNQEYKKDDLFCGLPVDEIESMQEKYNPNFYYVFTALSSGNLNRDRAKVYKFIKDKGYKIPSYISSRAFVWNNVKIGENCFIFENNVIQANVDIGNNVVLWSGNHVGHRTVIRDNCFISSHVVISGFCDIGENTFMGVNSCVADHIKVSKDNFITIGSVITKNTKENKFYKGNPAEESKVEVTKFFKINK